VDEGESVGGCCYKVEDVEVIVEGVDGVGGKDGDPCNVHRIYSQGHMSHSSRL
jgi:hypothetical protein